MKTRQLFATIPTTLAGRTGRVAALTVVSTMTALALAGCTASAGASAAGSDAVAGGPVAPAETPSAGAPALGTANLSAGAPVTATGGDAVTRFLACLHRDGLSGADLIDARGIKLVVVPGADQVTTDLDTAPIATLFTENGVMAAPRDARFFANDPIMRDIWAGCEAEVPDFSQGESTFAQIREMMAEAGAATAVDAFEQALEFAQCARDAGFAWVGDPTPAAATMTLPRIDVPNHVTEGEFRLLLQTCFDPDSQFIIMPEISGMQGDIMPRLTAIMNIFNEFVNGPGFQLRPAN